MTPPRPYQYQNEELSLTPKLRDAEYSAAELSIPHELFRGSIPSSKIGGAGGQPPHVPSQVTPPQVMAFERLSGWEKKDFQIMTAQALNLAVEYAASKHNVLSTEEKALVELAGKYFRILLRLRRDKELQELYVR